MEDFFPQELGAVIMNRKGSLFGEARIQRPLQLGSLGSSRNTLPDNSSQLLYPHHLPLSSVSHPVAIGA
jgi:hypothetical protein